MQSARKVIDEAKAPSRSSSSKSSTQSLGKAEGGKTSSARSVCSQHSYQVYTPRKTPRELFDMTDASLASVINSDSINLREAQSGREESDADKTELELLEDIFYVL